MLLDLRVAIEVNRPVRIAESAITDAMSDNIILGQPPHNRFFDALADHLAHSPSGFHCTKGHDKSYRHKH
jgi:hypothetical protein